jgi:small GTP-binding protein
MNEASVNNMDKIIMAKVIIVGDSSVGKTTIRKRFMGEGFTKSHLATLGADFSEKKVFLKHPTGDSVELRLQIWDIAGQVTFALMRKRFLKGAKIVIFVYDRTNKESFDNIDTWMREVVDANDTTIMPLIVVGNKSDLTEKLEVDNTKIHKYIQELKDRKWAVSSFIHRINTSALTGKNIESLFEFASKGFLMILDKDKTWLDAEMISSESMNIQG